MEQVQLAEALTARGYTTLMRRVRDTWGSATVTAPPTSGPAFIEAKLGSAPPP